MAGDVFESLPARPEIDAVADLGIAGDGADPRICKVGNQLGDGVGGDHSVRVDADIELFVQLLERKVERGGFASVGLGQDADTAGGDLRAIGVARDVEGVVGRSVVDDDHVEIFVVGVEHRADGANDDLLLVVGGDEHRDAGIEIGRGSARAAQAIDDREDAHQQQPRAHQHVADEEDQDDEMADNGQPGKCDGIRDCAQGLPEVKRGHNFRGGLAHERRDGNNGIAVSAQGVNDHRQRGHGGAAIAAAVVEQDDGAPELRTGLHLDQLIEDRLRNLLRGLADALIPIVGVDLVADDDVAVVLYTHDGRSLIVGVRLLVNVVGRAEIKRLHAELAGEQALR